MDILDQLLNLPHAYSWLPTSAFVMVVIVLYWLSRPADVTAELAATAPPKPMFAPTPRDQRGTSRRNGNPVEVHVAAPEDKKKPGIGSVLDRSMGGMRLALFHEVEVGIVLSIRPIHADNMVPWVDIEVRSCKLSSEMPGQFEIGCQYVKSPPYSIQLLFG